MIFAGPIFEGWYWTALFLIIFVLPVVALMAYLMIITYTSVMRRRGNKDSRRATIIFSIIAVIISVPLSILIVKFGVDTYAAHNDAKYYTKSKQFSIKRFQSKDGKTLRAYDYELDVINSECQKPEKESEDKKTKFAWYLNVQSAEDKPFTLVSIHNLQGAVVVCPNARIERQGKSVGISSLAYGTNLIVTYEWLKVGGRYDHVVRAIEVTD